MRRSLQLSYINPPLNVAEVSLEALISFHLCFVLIFISYFSLCGVQFFSIIKWEDLSEVMRHLSPCLLTLANKKGIPKTSLHIFIFYEQQKTSFKTGWPTYQIT